jgi:hypothetical protein
MRCVSSEKAGGKTISPRCVASQEARKATRRMARSECFYLFFYHIKQLLEYFFKAILHVMPTAAPRLDEGGGLASARRRTHK